MEKDMEKDLQNKLDSRNIVLFFGAQWCQPCKMHRPACERMSKSKGFEFEYVSIHDDYGQNFDSMIDHFDIHMVPYIYASYEGIVLHFPFSALEENLKSLTNYATNYEIDQFNHKF